MPGTGGGGDLGQPCGSSGHCDLGRGFRVHDRCGIVVEEPADLPPGVTYDGYYATPCVKPCTLCATCDKPLLRVTYNIQLLQGCWSYPVNRGKANSGSFTGTFDVPFQGGGTGFGGQTSCSWKGIFGPGQRYKTRYQDRDCTQPHDADEEDFVEITATISERPGSNGGPPETDASISIYAVDDLQASGGRPHQLREHGIQSGGFACGDTAVADEWPITWDYSYHPDKPNQWATGGTVTMTTIFPTRSSSP